MGSLIQGMTDSGRVQGRPDYLHWEDYFMGVACLAKERSKIKLSQVGACIVGKDRKILGVGYNGLPARCKEEDLHCDDNEVDENGDPADDEAWLPSKYPYVCHAASNAIQFSSGDLRGSTMYTTLYPVYECAKRISQAGITKVVYLKKGPGMDTATVITEKLFGIEPNIQLDEFKADQEIIKLKLSREEVPTTTDEEEVQHVPSDSGSSTNNTRKNISWDQYHMALARLASHRSKDPNLQVGACITDDDHKVVGLGWNGMPKGDDSIDWSKEGKMPYVCHAEFNALMHKTVASVKDCTMYVTLHPCNCCAKDIIQAGIKEVIYLDWPKSKRGKKEYKDAAKLFHAAKDLKYRQFDQNREEPIVLDLTHHQTA